jgi:anion-transporting  ArsA/GET3 family ATPase
VELFPFLSILACIIGSLFLMITGIALGQMGQKNDDEAIERAKEFLDLQRKMKQRDESARRALDELEAARRRLAELKKLLEELARLKTVKDPAAELAALKARLLAEQAALDTQIADLLKRHADYTNLTARLKTEIDRRNAVPTDSLLRIQPTGGGSLEGLKPLFAEATRTELVLHRDPMTRIPAAQVTNNADYAAWLQQTIDNPTSLLVLLVRTNGVGVYSLAKRAADARGARYGKLPLLGDGTIDLSAFSR